MNYYFLIKDKYIIGAGQCYCTSEGCTCLEVTEEQYNLVQEKGKKYFIYENNELTVNPNYEQEQLEKEQARINNLTMTALDLITVLQEAGLTLEQINEYLEANLQLKMQLTYCQNVYCGVVRQLLPITIGEITITDKMIVEAFKNKNNEN